MDLIERIIGETQERYKEKYLKEEVCVVTGEKDVINDDYKRPNSVTVMKYQTVKDKEDFMVRGYKEHNKRTYARRIEVIKPRRFYKAEDVYAYARHINRLAGRTLEDAEMNLLLKTIARGRQYELVCLVDITDELEGVTKWER